MTQQAAPDSAIDFVILWVDGNDPDWRAEKERHAANADPARLYQNPAHRPDALGGRRFHDFGTLRYALRSMEAYAPWFRRLWLVTDGQIPDWLNTAHPRLTHVTHRQLFRDAACLPSFNSNAIQMNLHHLPELAEQFVLFDDDKILTAPHTPTDFFRGGLPVKPAFLGCFTDHTPFQTNCRLNLARMKRAGGVFTPAHLKKLLCLPDARVHLFNLLVLAQALLRREQLFPGGYDHLPFAYLKSLNQRIEAETGDYLCATTTHKFRELEEASPWFLNMHYYAKGAYAPGGVKSRFIFIDDPMQSPEHFSRYRNTKFESLPTYWLLKYLLKGRYKALCVQDHTTDQLGAAGEEAITRALSAYLETLLPAKSGFEK